MTTVSTVLYGTQSLMDGPRFARTKVHMHEAADKLVKMGLYAGARVATAAAARHAEVRAKGEISGVRTHAFERCHTPPRARTDTLQ